MLKTALALHDKVLPPSLNFDRPNPNVDWAASPFAVNTELRDWEVAPGRTRVAGVSAFGFGGTNFHVVMEEHVPGHLTTNGHRASISVPASAGGVPPPRRRPGRAPRAAATAGAKPPLRGALVLGGRRRGGARQRAAHRAGRGAPGPPPRARRRRAPPRCARPSGSRSTTPTARTSWPRPSSRCARCRRDNPAAWTALRAPRDLPRRRRARQGRLPLHRPGLAVRQHAGRAARRASRSSPTSSTRPTRSWRRCSRAAG